MFVEPTVFILGAGASWHYSYPTGEQLVKRIIEKTDLIMFCLMNEIQNYRSALDVSVLPQFIAEKYPPYNDQGYFVKILNDFQNFQERLKDVDPPVIDYFLGWNADLVDIGRLMISWVILDSEREQKQNGGNANRIRALENSCFHEAKRINRLDNFPDNWYRFLLYKLVSGCKGPDGLESNKVNIITFNYDTSLEKFLYQGLGSMKFMKGRFPDVDRFLQDRFIHVYGAIRDNPYGDSKIIEAPPALRTLEKYKSILDQAYKASKGIRTIDPDDKEDLNLSKKTKEIIDEALNVYILGFGFDANNNKRLGLECASRNGIEGNAVCYKRNTEKNVFFTNFEDKNSINKRVGQLFTGDPATFLQDKSKINTGAKNAYAPDWSGFYSWHYEKSTKDVYGALESDFDFL